MTSQVTLSHYSLSGLGTTSLYIRAFYHLVDILTFTKSIIGIVVFTKLTSI